MCDHRQYRVFLSISVVLLLGSILVHAGGLGPVLEQGARAAQRGPLDSAGQRTSIIEELRAMNDLLAKADARAARSEQERQRLEERLIQIMDRRHKDLSKLLQSGTVKVQLASPDPGSIR